MKRVVGAVLAVWTLVTLGAWGADWSETIKLSGDLRYRFDYTDDETKPDEQQQDRIRARLVAEAQVNDTVKTVFGLASGSSPRAPTSANQTLGEAWTGKSVWLDLAYLDCAIVSNHVNALAGKMRNPFICVSDLIWDTDVNPEGVALQGKTEMEGVKLMANAGYLWIVENPTGADVKEYAGQLAAEKKLTDQVKLTVGATYYTYDNIEGWEVKSLNAKGEPKALGNSTVKLGTNTDSAVVYKYDYTPVEGFANLELTSLAVPVNVYGQYTVNNEADDENTGFLCGLTVGKAKDKGTWEVGYNYCEIEKDAVLAVFTDADRFGGGTDVKGHKVTAKYQLGKNWGVAATWFGDERPIAEGTQSSDFDRLQLDFNLKF